MGQVQGKHSVRRTKAAFRRNKAAQLRIDGLSFVAIGDELGVTTERARQLVDEAITQLVENNLETLEKARQIELERIDVAIRAIWGRITASATAQPAATEAADNQDIEAAARAEYLTYAAVDRFIKLSDRRAKLLGLDAPAKHEGNLGIESKSGVLVVPGMFSPEQWQAQGEQSSTDQ